MNAIASRGLVFMEYVFLGTALVEGCWQNCCNAQFSPHGIAALCPAKRKLHRGS